MNPEQNTHRHPERVGFDAPYTFGRPASTYLAPREIVRLTILRSKVRENHLSVAPDTAAE